MTGALLASRGGLDELRGLGTMLTGRNPAGKLCLAATGLAEAGALVPSGCFSGCGSGGGTGALRVVGIGITKPRDGESTMAICVAEGLILLPPHRSAAGSGLRRGGLETIQSGARVRSVRENRKREVASSNKACSRSTPIDMVGFSRRTDDDGSPPRTPGISSLSGSAPPQKADGRSGFQLIAPRPNGVPRPPPKPLRALPPPRIAGRKSGGTISVVRRSQPPPRKHRSPVAVAATG